MITLIILYKKKINILYFVLSIFISIPIANSLTNLKLDNLPLDKNGIMINDLIKNHSDNKRSYYYAICPFISKTCYSGYEEEKDNEWDKKFYNKEDNYKDYLGNIYFSNRASQRTKYLDNKALTYKSILYKTIFIPFSQEDLIMYDYSIGKSFNLNTILIQKNKCELLLYGAQNGWENYKNQLVKEIEKTNNEECLEYLDEVTLEDKGIIENKNQFLDFLKTGNIK